MKWVGLTGGVACGKSEVSRILVEVGVPVVDADKVAHLALQKGQDTFLKIVQTFGTEICQVDGEIDRKKLGAIVFKDWASKTQLERIVHPFVQSKVKEERKRLEKAGHRWAVYDVPLLFEKNLMAQFDRIAVVYCRPEQQMERLMKRNSLSKKEAQLRLANQMPIDEKKKLANDVIDNIGTLEQLRENVLLWKQSIDAKYS